VCPSPLPTLFYSVGSPLLFPQAKHHHPSFLPTPPLPTPPRPLAAFPTQSDRRAASSPPGRAIPRRFRAIRRGFGAPPGVSRRIGGDRDFPAGESSICFGNYLEQFTWRLHTITFPEVKNIWADRGISWEVLKMMNHPQNAQEHPQ